MILITLALSIHSLTTYQPSKAQYMAKLSAISRCYPPSILNWTCSLCNSQIHIQNLFIIQNSFTKVLAFGGFSTELDRIIIIFRRTQNIQNYIEDADFKFTTYFRCRDCKVHEGFLFAYKSINSSIFQNIELLTKLYQDKQIAVGGHSLGGALSTLAAIELQLYYKKVRQFYNFGAPRVGNQNFATFQKLILNPYRVVHYKDLAPHLPPREFNYKHSAREILYDEQFKNYVVCDDSGQDSQCSDRWKRYNGSDHDLYFVNQKC